MPSKPVNRVISSVSRRVPGLRGLPMLRLLALAEVLILAQHHLERLTPAERRRAVQLVRIGRGRTRNLNAHERAELADLVGKAEPRAFVADAVHKLSPVPVPASIINRIVRR